MRSQTSIHQQFSTTQEIDSSSSELTCELVDFDHLTRLDQRSIVIHLLEVAFMEIESENRPLTEWEADTLSSAIGACMTGMFRLAMTKIELSQLKRKVAPRPQIWFSNCEEYTLESLKEALKSISTLQIIQ